jgi:hypothetical protein
VGVGDVTVDCQLGEGGVLCTCQVAHGPTSSCTQTMLACGPQQSCCATSFFAAGG